MEIDSFIVFNENENEDSLNDIVLNSSFLKSTGTTINSNTNINQSYIDTNPGPYTIEGGTESNPINIEIIDNLNITSLDTYFIINSDYITINSDPKKGYVININNVLLFNGLVSNLKNSNITINGLTIKGTNSTLNDKAGWIGFTEYGVGCTNNKITNCSSYLPIGGTRSGGIVGRNCKADITNCINYGDILVNPNILSDGNNDVSNTGGICGTLFEGTILNCKNYGNINGRQSAGISGLTDKNITIKKCTNYGKINGYVSSGILFGNFKNKDYVNSATLINCINYYQATINYNYCSGIVFGIDNGTNALIESCINYADLSDNIDSSAGIINQVFGSSTNDSNIIINLCSNRGVIGKRSGGILRISSVFSNQIVKITKCINSGEILGRNSSGILAVVSNIGNTTEISECYNNGTISAEICGGIVYYIYDDNKLVINKCYNDGAILGKNAGGIMGHEAWGTINDSINAGCVIGEGAGGICGAGSRNVIVNNCINNGEISGNNAGGILGAWSQGTAQNCSNAGAIIGLSTGGIFGEFSKGNNVNSVNLGNIYGVNARAI